MQLFLRAKNSIKKSTQWAMHILQSPRRHYVAGFVFTISAFLFSLGNIYSSDEGTILNGAWKMFQGRHLYTDFFAFNAPGSYILTLFSFHVLGPYYFSARIVCIFFLLLSVYAVYAIGALLQNKYTGICAAAAWMMCSFVPALVINHNPLSSYVASIAVWLLILALKKKKDIFFLYSGFMCGAVIVFLQTKGLALGLGFFIFLLVYAIRRAVSLRQILWFSASLSVLPLIAMWYWGASFLYHLLIEWPLHHYWAANHPSLIPLLSVCIIFGIIAHEALRRAPPSDKDSIIILIVAQLCLFLSIINLPDSNHILLNSFCFVLIAMYSIHVHIQSLTPWIQGVILTEIPLLVVLSYAITFALYSIQTQRAFLKTVQDLSITSIYAHPFVPEFYFELRVPDPYPYDILHSRMYSPEAFDANLRVLLKEKPEYVFLNYGLASKFNYDNHTPLDDYIAAHYSPIKHFSFITIMKRK